MLDSIRLYRARPPDAPSQRPRNDLGSRSDSLSRGVRVGVVPLRSIEPGTGNELALALVEEITTALAQFRWITCVPGVMPADAVDGDRQNWSRQPASGLDFLLDGTLQRNGSRVRIIMRLSDIRTGGTLVWSPL